MEIKFSNWKSIDLQALDTGITSALGVFDTIYNSFDATNFDVDLPSITNTRITGTSGIYNVVVLGSNFTTSVPFETYNSISLINSTNTAEQLLTTGSVTYNYDTDSYTGFYNKISYVSNNAGGLTNLLVEGRFNVDVFGDTNGGTANKYNVTFAGNTLNLTGSMLLDANDDIVGGTISSFTFADNQGSTLTASGLSISATEFYRLTDPTAPNSFLTLDAFYNYLTDASRLAGNDIITANATDTQSDTINGFAGNDTLGGGGGNDTLNGGIGIDILDGGTGTDTMDGGDGNDTYIVDNSSDIVIETNASSVGGIDTVRANLANGQTYVLTPNVENLILTDGSANGGIANSNGTGNALNNVITGNAGSNTLDGAAGVDSLVGGLESDKYIVDLVQTGTTAATFRVALQDTVTEGLNAGTNDILELRGNFAHDNATTLILGANLETLDASQTSTTKLNLTGNALANTLIGNAADNILDGGAGVDTLVGGTGNDTYIVDIIPTTAGVAPAPVVVTGAQLQDVITETSGTTNGIDTLRLRGSVVIPATTTATEIALTGALANIENIDISLTGTTRLNITGNAENNILIGNAANNTLTGGNGNDRLDGGLGADTMDGGAGDDTYVIDNLLDVITADSSGNDTAEIRLTTGTYALAAGSGIENVTLAGVAAINATGDAGANSLTGNAAANILNGGGGADTLRGGDGADTYIIDGNDTVIEDNALAAGGIDTVRANLANGQTYVLTPNVENLILTDGSANGGIANSNGTGNALNNVITGNAGSNTLDGAAGVDSLVGGLESDKYIVDLVQTGTTAATFRVALQDTVTEGLNAGTNDILELRGNFAHDNATTLILGANLETLDASQTSTTKLNLTGNALANTLIGNAADNILDGGAGVDTLVGGTGNDTYIVDIIPTTAGVAPAPVVVTGAQLQDVITETSGTTNGIDTLRLRGSVVIPATTTATEIALTGALANIENIDISLTGTTRLNITGNAENNILIGNAANNTLTGGNGNDRLDGGLGADTMDGGAGDDTYVIDNLLDVITADSSGNDTAEIRLTTGTYALAAGSGIENVTLAGVAAINATGDAGANSLTGNAAANILNGGGGADTLRGGDGADTYIIDGNDTVIEDNALAAGGIDTVRANLANGQTYVLTPNVENLILTDGSANGGIANSNGTGNALNNVITGNAGSNTLDGAAGVDSLVGGLESDKYIVDLVQTGTTAATFRVALQDTVTEGLNAGTNDILELRGNFAHDNATTLILGANLETLDASQTSTTKLNLTGNALANTLIGNAADNILDGGAGVDTLVGGTGNDTYIVDIIPTTAGVAPAPVVVTGAQLQDVITETSGTTNGIDTLRLRGSVVIPATTTATEIALTGALANIENIDISLTGTTRLNITGNAENNILIGNAANNTLTGGNGNDRLDGGLGADTMDGGAGDDTYVIDNLLDVITADSSGNDTAEIRLTTGTYALAAGSGIENVTLAGVAAINATGDAGANSLTGNAAANILNGGAGNDTLNGGAGNDTIIGGEGNDEITGGAGNDTLTGGIGADIFVWELADKGTNGRPAIDKITDFSLVDDRLDLRDLLVGESSANILNFLDVTTSTAAGVTNTEIRISNTGGFAGGTFAAAAENQHITLVGVNLFTDTGTSNELAMLQNLITNNKLIID